MDWYIVLLILFGSLVTLMMTGLPVAFCFMLMAIGSLYLMWGGGIGLTELGNQIFASLVSVPLLPLPPFILMGEIMFQSGTANGILNAVDKWFGRTRARLSLIAAISICATIMHANIADAHRAGMI